MHDLVPKPRDVAAQLARLNILEPANLRKGLHGIGDGTEFARGEELCELIKDERPCDVDSRLQRVVCREPMAYPCDTIALATQHLDERIAVAVLAKLLAVRAGDPFERLGRGIDQGKGRRVAVKRATCVRHPAEQPPVK